MYFKSPLKYVPRLPGCSNCKYARTIGQKQVCILFKYKFAPINNEFELYVETEYARSDNSLCGPNGEYFKTK